MNMALGKGLNALIGAQTTSPKKQIIQQTIQKEFASENADVSDRILHVPITQIHANPNQPRKHFGIDELQDLVNSIEKHGILQPIVVAEEVDGTYQIIAGERRFRAAQMIGMARVPCIVKPVDKREQLEISLVENLQRKNLNPIEEAYAFQRLVDEFNLTQQDVADSVGKSRPYVANMIRLLELPQDIQKGLVEEKLNYTKARALLGLPTIRQQLKAYYDIIGDKTISARATEQMVRKHSQNRGRRDPLLDAIEERLRDRLGTKVYVTNNKGRGTIKIDFFSDEEMHQVISIIEGKE